MATEVRHRPVRREFLEKVARPVLGEILAPFADRLRARGVDASAIARLRGRDAHHREVRRAPWVGALFCFAAACGGARDSGARAGAAPAATPLTHDDPSRSEDLDASAPLPQLPPPPTATTADKVEPPDTHAAYHGSDPFAAPPRKIPPPKLEPVPPRSVAAPSLVNPGDVPYALATCPKLTACGDCVRNEYCGWCEASGRCLPRDRWGPFGGTCSAGFLRECSSNNLFESNNGAVRKNLATAMTGLTPEGDPIDTAFRGGPSSVKLPVRRGYCYGVVVRTSSDYKYPESPTVRIAPSEPIVGDGGLQNGAGWLAEYLTPYCPQASGQIEVSVTERLSFDATWRVQLFRKEITEAALREAAKVHDTAERRAAVRKVCAACARTFVECKLTGTPGCAAKYYACMKNAGVTERDCETGDVPVPKDEQKPPWQVSLPPACSSAGG
jgi:hypothetical protein